MHMENMYMERATKKGKWKHVCATIERIKVHRKEKLAHMEHTNTFKQTFLLDASALLWMTK